MKKGKTMSSERVGCLIRREAYGYAESFKDVGRSALRSDGTVAVLGDGSSGCCGDESGRGGDVEGAAGIAAGAAGVDEGLAFGG
jgi:hypothetical protein